MVKGHIVFALGCTLVAIVACVCNIVRLHKKQARRGLRKAKCCKFCRRRGNIVECPFQNNSEKPMDKYMFCYRFKLSKFPVKRRVRTGLSKTRG